jgi:hypothetical protein
MGHGGQRLILQTSISSPISMMKSFTELSRVMGEDVEGAEVFQEQVDQRGDGGSELGSAVVVGWKSIFS